MLFGSDSPWESFISNQIAKSCTDSGGGLIIVISPFILEGGSKKTCYTLLPVQNPHESL